MKTWSGVNLLTSDVVWVQFGPARGREQDGRRPAVVVSSNGYLAVADTLAIVVPVTSRDRGWPNHVRLSGDTGLSRGGFAMVEQVQTISRKRIVGTLGSIDEECLRDIRLYLQDFLDL